MNGRSPTQTMTAAAGSVHPTSTGPTARSLFSRTGRISARAGCFCTPREWSDRDGCARPLEHELAVLGVDADGVAVLEVALEEPQRQGVLEQALDRPLERPRAVRRVPAGIREHRLGLVAEIELQPTLLEPRAEPSELLLDDLADLVARQ